MNAFHVIGALAAIWAVVVALLGITREDFPGGKEKIVGAISVLLVLGAISSAIITGILESDEEGPEHGGGGAEGTSESHP